MNNISFIEFFFFYAVYNDLVSIVGPLKERKFKGVLVDTYGAEEMKEFSSEELRVNKIIDHNTMELYLERTIVRKDLSELLRGLKSSK